MKATEAGDTVDVNATNVEETKVADATRIEEAKEQMLRASLEGHLARPITEGLSYQLVTAVLSYSHCMFTEVTSQVTALGARLAVVQQQCALAVPKQRAKYEAELKIEKTIRLFLYFITIQ